MRTSEILTHVHAAFDGDDVPTKNIWLRRAYDEIERQRNVIDEYERARLGGLSGIGGPG